MPADLATVAATLERELGARYHATVVGPEHVGAVIGRGLLRALAAGLSAAAPVVDAILARAERVSVTIPWPGGSLIVLSPAAAADPLHRAETVCHEMQHARVIHVDDDARVVADYLLSGELRGLREAEAYAVGLWTRYLLTGDAPTLDAALASLSSDTYHLDAGDIATARATLESHLESIRAGGTPPLEVCRVVREILRQQHPDAIVPVEHQAVTP